METLRRPDLTPERETELDNLAMQIMLQFPADLGECLVVRDKCAEILGKRVMRALHAGKLNHLVQDRPIAAITHLKLV